MPSATRVSTCIVTGAASGMGEAVARILVDIGAEVTGLDIRPMHRPRRRHPRGRPA